ncbi:13389_t:CDS:2 [Racocetra fulgida]|uniref:13389_t:CDS:1 n=1 Tax=Racocetra fulgida TaxID=60492 RepID=A0A9N8VQZ7_9GLOM|nr:13389_t:CDS:2 [Racocetra fulgida]
MSAIRAIKTGNNQKLIIALRDINSTIIDINATLQRMHEKCDPYVFYHMIRPYLSGWENEDRLPKGLIYEGVDGNDENGDPIYRKYVGASAGQSALIQALDIALNIEHYPTGDLAKVANIRSYIVSQANYDSNITISSPDEDMGMLQGTTEMVRTYNESTNNVNTNNKEANTKVKITTTKSIEIKGTGGTNLIPFLKQMRDETMIQEIQNFYE